MYTNLKLTQFIKLNLTYTAYKFYIYNQKELEIKMKWFINYLYFSKLKTNIEFLTQIKFVCEY